MNKTLEEASLLMADLARLSTPDLVALLPHIRDLRQRIRERDFALGTPSQAVLEQAEAMATAHLTEDELRDYNARRRVAETVQIDGLTCLECGRKTESLVLHFTKGHHMTWDEYLAKWDLNDLGERFEELEDYSKTSGSFIAKQRLNARRNVELHPEKYTGAELARYREEQKKRS
ncbi:MAG: MucR family transcriptional regulator [Pseudomonadota bacterium]|nr:MucR family transcriptional regulator [Pseudomonadota bacterium]